MCVCALVFVGVLSVCACVECVCGCVEYPPGCYRPALLQSERVDCSGSSSPIRRAANVFFCHIRSDAVASFSPAGGGKHHRRAERQRAFARWAVLTYCVDSFQTARLRKPVIIRHVQFTWAVSTYAWLDWWYGQSRSWFHQPAQSEQCFISDRFGTCWGQTTDLYSQEHVTETVARHSVSPDKGFVVISVFSWCLKVRQIWLLKKRKREREIATFTHPVWLKQLFSLWCLERAYSWETLPTK